MVYYKRKSRRTARRQPRRAKRYKRKLRPSRTLRASNFMTIQRKSEWYTSVAQITASNNDYYSGKALTFNLQQLPNYLELITLFDQYRINWVKVSFFFAGNSLALADTYFQVMPMRVITAADYDDDTAPSSNQAGWSTMEERYKPRHHLIPGKNGKSAFSVFLRPRVLTPIYQTGVTNAYGPKRSVWIDCSNREVPHYALKYIFMIPRTGATGNSFELRYDTQITLNVSFKGVH